MLQYNTIFWFVLLGKIGSLFCLNQGADFKTNKTTKQKSYQEYYCFLDEYFISTNKKQVKYCFSFPIGPNKIVQQKNNNILDEILVSLFYCF